MIGQWRPIEDFKEPAPTRVLLNMSDRKVYEGKMIYWTCCENVRVLTPDNEEWTDRGLVPTAWMPMPDSIFQIKAKRILALRAAGKFISTKAEELEVVGIGIERNGESSVLSIPEVLQAISDIIDEMEGSAE